MHPVIADRTKTVHADHPQGRRLQVMPILGPSHADPTYELLRPETAPLVRVTEISFAGSVPELQVCNDLPMMVYLMDGQELVGAKQNRILNTDVLVPARTQIRIPVSCVEQGRWQHVSETFRSGKSASHRIRAAKSSRVHESLRREARHDADQGAVWDEVEASMQASNTASPSMALADAYTLRETELETFRSSLQMPSEAVGLAVFHDGRFQGLDLFDRHATLQYFWSSLVDSYAIDFLAATAVDAPAAASPEAGAVAAMLGKAAAGQWEPYASPGAGQD